MPLKSDEVLGTNANGSKNGDYCRHCFAKGKFTKDCTMDEMIASCVAFLDEFNNDSVLKFSKKEAISVLEKILPTLKRWQA
jgi:hypothetical protein